jgi:hypothetical protein
MLNLGDRMVANIKLGGTLGVKNTFDSSPLLKDHWDNEIGPMIKTLSAAKGKEEESKIIRDIYSR